MNFEAKRRENLSLMNVNLCLQEFELSVCMSEEKGSKAKLEKVACLS